MLTLNNIIDPVVSFFFALQMNVVIRPSKKRDKKLDAIFPDGRILSFGQKGSEDYTSHKNLERKNRYLVRHAADPKSI